MGKQRRQTEQITQKANSNLAFALKCVSAERRADLTTLYAFCRIIDDIADDPSLSIQEKQEGFDYWKKGLSEGFSQGEVEREVQAMQRRHHLSAELFTEIIRGCEMDLQPLRFGTWEDLQAYTYRVAGVVGLISLPLFGANAERARPYALKLGDALQLTNIIRDVGEDLDNGVRIYLPLADLARFQYTERDLIGKVYDGRFLALMQYQYARAQQLYREADALLPKEDEAALKSARIMGEIYSALLEKIRQKNFQVLEKRVRLSKLQKVCLLVKGML